MNWGTVSVMGFLYCLYWLVVVVIMIRVMLRNHDAVKTLAWIMVFIFMPFLGLVLYFFFGRDTRKKRMAGKRLMSQIKQHAALKVTGCAKGNIQPEYQSLATFFENEDYVFTGWPHQGWEVGSFCGIFDGNGATVYGLYQVSENNAGLFSNVDAGAVIKNIALKNSYLTSTASNYQVGGLAAVTNGNTYQLKTNGAIWFDSCVVANNYMYNACTSWERSGVLAGSFQNDIIMIDNCLVAVMQEERHAL